MSRRSIAGAFILGCWLQLAGPLPAQESTPIVSTASSVGERAYPYRALPVEVWVERSGERLPVDRVPELVQGDVLLLRVDLEAPELSSENAGERNRLRDWSVAWFLTTPEGSLVYDSTRRGRTDRGRIDLARGEREIRIKVENERQKFPILLFVRTRTLESWEEIQRTRKIKASNFVDHFGRYSDVVAGYENLQAFLGALQREKPQADTLEERLEAGFSELGFTVDSKMKLDDPQVVAKLLGELERSMGQQNKTFKAQAAGKMLSQMLGDQDLGLIGAAASIGGFFYRATDYQESYHWSSARLEPNGLGRYWVKSAERIRYGEAEQAQDGTARQNVRSILVCTPMAAAAPRKPSLGWSTDGPSSLVPAASSNSAPEVRVVGDLVQSKTHPALVESAVGREVKVWDSHHGEDSPLRASIGSNGTLSILGFENFWSPSRSRAEIKVLGSWGFEPLLLAHFYALASLPEGELKAVNAPYLLSQGQRYRVEFLRSKAVALGTVRFGGRKVIMERDREGEAYVTLEPDKFPTGLTTLEVFAGTDTSGAARLLSQDFRVVPGYHFHVVWPLGSRSLQLVCARSELREALREVTEVRVGELIFSRESSDSDRFELSAAGVLDEVAPASTAELHFAEPDRGAVSSVHLERPAPPEQVAFELYPHSRSGPGSSSAKRSDVGSLSEHFVELTPESQLLAVGQSSEFRLRAGSDWPDTTTLRLELVSSGGQTKDHSYSVSAKGEERLQQKGALLYGEFTPSAPGRLSCRLSSPIAQTDLRLEWDLPTDWTVVELPQIHQVRVGETVMMKGENLDVTVARVYRAKDPAVDPEGAAPRRAPDGSYTVDQPWLNPAEFWICLNDDPNRLRLRVVTR